MGCCLCPDFSPCWDAAQCHLQRCNNWAPVWYPSRNFKISLFPYYGTICISLMHMTEDVYTWHNIFLVHKIIETPKRPLLNTHQGRIKSISMLSVTLNSIQSVFKAWSTNSFSRAYFMLGKPLQTTDSIHVCGHLITSFVVWSLEALKWENLTVQHVIRV